MVIIIIIIIIINNNNINGEQSNPAGAAYVGVAVDAGKPSHPVLGLLWQVRLL